MDVVLDVVLTKLTLFVHVGKQEIPTIGTQHSTIFHVGSTAFTQY